MQNKPNYRDGGEGFLAWCEDYVHIPIFIEGLPCWCPVSKLPTEINPITGRSSRMMWDEIANVMRKALVMNRGKFIYRLIVFCWPRGDGKSLTTCLIQLWKFFNFPRQQIMLGANSKDQVKFVHFDIMKDIILNSPKLLAIVGQRNVQEKQIQLKDKRGIAVSIIRSISSFSGIVSNITGYTFSEIFDMKNPRFFTQLDGSIRNIPNALGVIDSTVSRKEHILFRLYEQFTLGKSKTVFFHYRSSRDGNAKDFWNPEMSQEQLDEYRSKFPPQEYAMYFKNTWESAISRLFSREEVMACRYIGAYNSLGEQNQIVNSLKSYHDTLDELEENVFAMEKSIRDPEHDPTKLISHLIPTEKVYSLQEHRHIKMATLDDLNKLSDLYDTNFAILSGCDRADPLKVDVTVGARTIVTVVAKGLPGSRSDPHKFLDANNSASKNFIYFVLHLEHVAMSDINSIQSIIERAMDEYESVDSFCTERWGMWDVEDWCVNNSIYFEAVTGSYDRQKAGFTEMYYIIRDGKLKLPPLAVPGSKGDDIFIEEAKIFDHSVADHFYGSPEKTQKYGIQDDAMYALNWCIYGGRFLSVEDFAERKGKQFLGTFIKNKELIGNYSENRRLA